MWSPQRREVVALLALLDLASEAEPRGWVKTSAIAARHGIPSAFLEQIVYRLVQLGYVRSRRGPSGGLQLARAPAQIRVGAVLRTIGEHTAREVGAARTLEEMVIGACEDANGALEHALDALTLENLRERAVRGGLVRGGKSALSFDI